MRTLVSEWMELISKPGTVLTLYMLYHTESSGPPCDYDTFIIPIL